MCSKDMVLHNGIDVNKSGDGVEELRDSGSIIWNNTIAASGVLMLEDVS